MVDESGTDVSLALVAGERRQEVESVRRGEGLEIAVIDATSPSVRVELRGPTNGAKPGSVQLKVETFSAEHRARPDLATRLRGYRAYSEGTRADRTAKDIVAYFAPRMDEAIAAFNARTGGDARLAAHARLVRAYMFYWFELDWREARDGARRAREEFAGPRVEDRLAAARARRIEAMSLQEMAHSSVESAASKLAAQREARLIYEELIRADSALDVVGRGKVVNDLALMDMEAQKWESAQRHFSEALALYRQAGFRAGELQTGTNLAVMAAKRGDYLLAQRAFGDVVASLDNIASAELRASVLVNAALVDINIGDTDRALERLLRAKAIAEKATLAAPRTRALQYMGLAYWARGEVDQARTFFDQAYEAQKALSDDLGMYTALRARGALLRDSGDARGALAAHRASLKHAHGSIFKLRGQIEIARDYAALMDRAQALAALRAGLRELDAADHPVRHEAQLALAEVLVMERARSAADTAEAVTLAGEALRRAQATADLPAEIVARRVLARVALERGARADAVRELESAIDLATRYSRGSSNPELQAASRVSQQQLYREYLDVQMDAGGAPERALEVLETVRALNFLLARASAGAPGTAELDALLGKLASRHVALAELRDRDEPDAAAIESLQLEMATLRAEIDSVRAARTTGGKGQNAAAGSGMRLPWKALAPGAVQLSYSLGSMRGYVWRRSSAGVEGWTLPGTASELRAAAIKVARIDRLQKPAAYDAALVELSSLLLPPGVITGGATSAAIVADDELSLIPFAALRSPTDRVKRFSETHVITMVPSLLDTREAEPVPARRWRLVAVRGAENAQGESTAMRGSALFPALPGAGAEIDALVKLFGAERQRVRVLEGEHATADGVRMLMRDGAEVMHFATHGLADLQHPLASLLSLPQGLLTAGQIQEWHGDVGLVFLSACETAVGPTRFAEGMPGLQRAFLRAGAGNVIATLWPVEDGLAREFAGTFYEELAGGATPPEALARTQRRWVSSASAESAQKGARRRVAAWGYVLYAR
jgi:tetratricopeptide (TPR) repeat protein